jgi:hypothetical protein
MKRSVGSRVVSVVVFQPGLPGYVQTKLPADYIELEKRIDALKQVHQKMLQVTYVRAF